VHELADVLSLRAHLRFVVADRELLRIRVLAAGEPAQISNGP
jgi:hypothetical protein